MAGSIADNLAAYKKFKYIAPATPNSLIDCSILTLNFAARKFIHVGMDPTNQFYTTIRILTPSRYVDITYNCMRHMYSLMGNILSFILDVAHKYERIIFLETECMKLSSMVYRGCNMLVIESKTITGCRVLLDRLDLINLQYLEWCLFETILRKNTITRPKVMNQFEEIVTFIKNNIIRKQGIEDMIVAIKNVDDETISIHIPKNSQSFVSQLKLLATKQLAEQCVIKIEDSEINKVN